MANPYYDHTTYPTPNAPGSSAQLRAELDLIEAGFDKLPTLTGNANKVVVVNSGETALAATSTVTGVTFSNPTITGGTINNTVIGGTTPAAGTFTAITGTSAAVNGNATITGSATVGGSNVVTESASQTLTNKTFNLSSNTFVATSAQLAAAITDESGSGALLFANSPAMTGTPTAPTAANGTNTTQIATTAFVAAGFAPFASPAFTGTPTAPTAALGTNTTQIATTAFVAGTAFSSALPAQTGNAGKYVTTNGSTASWASVFTANFQEFTASGTWTKPSGATFVMVEAWGGGGGGGSGRRGAAASARHGGDGGGGGAYVQRLFRASDLGATETVTIAAGGAGGAAQTVNSTNGINGTAGGNTTFGSWLTAYGGAGGYQGTTNPNSQVKGGGALSNGASGGYPALAAFGDGAFGAGYTSSTTARASGWGGGDGGPTSGTRVGMPGGCSFQGGPGGGGGGGIDTSNQPQLPGAGGSFAGATGGGPFGGAGVGRQGGGGGWVNELGTTTLSTYCAVYGGGIFAAGVLNSSSGAAGTVSTSSDGITWTQYPAPFTPYSLAYGNSLWILTDGSSRVWSTTDFITYTSGTSSPVATIRKLAYLNGVYFAIGDNGALATSTDLITWTSRTTGTSQALFDITWTGTNYVACSIGGVIIYSSNLSTWTAATGSFGTPYVIAAGAAGLVVAVLSSGATKAAYSTNHGQTWTLATTAPGTNADNQNQLAFGGGTFVFANQSSEVWTTTDGITWTQQTDGTTDAYIGVAYSGSTWFVGSTTANSNIGITSTNLTSWTTRSVTALNAASGAGGAAGANWGGGGGGGGASTNGNNSGAGGAGADGRVRVYTW